MRKEKRKKRISGSELKALSQALDCTEFKLASSWVKKGAIVEVYWPSERKWYRGIIVRRAFYEFEVVYDDDGSEHTHGTDWKVRPVNQQYWTSWHNSELKLIAKFKLPNNFRLGEGFSLDISDLLNTRPYNVDDRISLVRVGDSGGNDIKTYLVGDVIKTVDNAIIVEWKKEDSPRREGWYEFRYYPRRSGILRPKRQPSFSSAGFLLTDNQEFMKFWSELKFISVGTVIQCNGYSSSKPWACPDPSCEKAYHSRVGLRLHLKQKHGLHSKSHDFSSLIICKNSGDTNEQRNEIEKKKKEEKISANSKKNSVRSKIQMVESVEVALESPRGESNQRKRKKLNQSIKKASIRHKIRKKSKLSGSDLSKPLNRVVQEKVEVEVKNNDPVRSAPGEHTLDSEHASTIKGEKRKRNSGEIVKILNVKCNLPSLMPSREKSADSKKVATKKGEVESKTSKPRQIEKCESKERMDVLSKEFSRQSKVTEGFAQEPSRSKKEESKRQTPNGVNLNESGSASSYENYKKPSSERNNIKEKEETTKKLNQKMRPHNATRQNSTLRHGDFIEVTWTGKRTYLCSIVVQKSRLYLSSLDGSFKQLIPFDPTKDVWRRVNSTIKATTETVQPLLNGIKLCGYRPVPQNAQPLNVIPARTISVAARNTIPVPVAATYSLMSSVSHRNFSKDFRSIHRTTYPADPSCVPRRNLAVDGRPNFSKDNNFRTPSLTTTQIPTNNVYYINERARGLTRKKSYVGYNLNDILCHSAPQLRTNSCRHSFPNESQSTKRSHLVHRDQTPIRAQMFLGVRKARSRELEGQSSKQDVDWAEVARDLFREPLPSPSRGTQDRSLYTRHIDDDNKYIIRTRFHPVVPLKKNRTYSVTSDEVRQQSDVVNVTGVWKLNGIDEYDHANFAHEMHFKQIGMEVMGNAERAKITGRIIGQALQFEHMINGRIVCICQCRVSNGQGELVDGIWNTTEGCRGRFHAIKIGHLSESHSS